MLVLLSLVEHSNDYPWIRNFLKYTEFYNSTTLRATSEIFYDLSGNSEEFKGQVNLEDSSRFFKRSGNLSWRHAREKFDLRNRSNLFRLISYLNSLIVHRDRAILVVGCVRARPYLIKKNLPCLAETIVARDRLIVEPRWRVKRTFCQWNNVPPWTLGVSVPPRNRVSCTSSAKMHSLQMLARGHARFCRENL